MKARHRGHIPNAGFSPRRGTVYFFVGFVVGCVLVGLNSLTGSVPAVSSAIIFIVGFATVAGVIGTFTDKVPL